MTLNKYHRFFVTLFGARWGLELSPVLFNGTGERYLDRYILYLGPINLRLHKFYSGDDLRAPHDHPWWFITFPFTSYAEQVEVCGCFPSLPPSTNFGCDITTGRCRNAPRLRRVVRAFRFHYRRATYRHIVLGPVLAYDDEIALVPPGTFWTFVIAGSNTNKWGFWPTPSSFVYWRDWK